MDLIKKLVRKHTNLSEDDLQNLYAHCNLRAYEKVSDGGLKKVKPKVVTSQWDTTLNLNEYGYRSDSFDGVDGFMFLGCSLTEGVGLEEHETWPWIVGKHFDVKVWNLGLSGEGDDMCFLNALRWIPKLKPKLVCMLIPPAGRFLFFDYDEKLFDEFHAYYLPNRPKFPWLFHENNLYLSTLKNVLGIKSICDEYDIPFVVESSINNLTFMSEDKIFNYPLSASGVEGIKGGLARDDNHPGPLWQQKISEYFIREVSLLNTEKIK